MNFADTLSRLDERLTAHERRASATSLREEYARLRDFLAERTAAQRDVETRLKMLGAGGFALASVGPHTDRLAQAAHDILVACRHQADAVDAKDARWQSLADDEHALNEALAQLYAAFRSEVQAQATPLSLRLIARGCSGSVRAAYERLERIDADLARLVPDDIPTNEATLTSARSLKQERDQLRAEIEQAVSADVLAFVESLAAGRVHLSDLTPEVLAWLKEHGLAPSIRLTI